MKLVCDEPSSLDQVTYYTILGLQPDPIQVDPDPDPQYGFSYDLSNLPGGEYTVRACACNDRACSIESNPFVFTLLPIPQQPVGLSIIS